MREASKTILMIFIISIIISFGLIFITRVDSVSVEVTNPESSTQSGDVIEIVDSNYVEGDVSIEDGTSVVEVNVPTQSVGYWTSDHTGLDKGEVILMDHSNKGTETANVTNNYITILTESGEKKIYRDVDVDLYLNLKVGDIIR